MVRRFTSQARAASEMVRVTAAGLGAGFSAGAFDGDEVVGDGAAAGGIVWAGVVDASVAVAAVPVVGVGAPVGSNIWHRPFARRHGEGTVIIPVSGAGGKARAARAKEEP